MKSNKTSTQAENNYLHVIECKPLENLNLDEDSEFKRNYSLNGMIQSPSYPIKYPKQLSCYFLIHAPKNHIVSLTGVENFDIEPSVDCSYDYLEIRDGKYGFSPFIGRYCDQNLPKFPINSTGRNLWIKFNSDESIEAQGFRIFYQLKRNGKVKELDYSTYAKLSHEFLKCDDKIFVDEGLEELTGVLTNYDIENYFDKNYQQFQKYLLRMYNYVNFYPILDCTIILETSTDKKIFVGIEEMIIVSSKNLVSVNNLDSIENCSENFFQLYDHSTSIENLKLNLCTGQKNLFYKSSTNKIFMRFNFVRRSNSDIFKFKIVFNPFTTGTCGFNETFQCADESCISQQYVCDGKRSCIFSEDESNCKQLLMATVRPKSEWSQEKKTEIMHRIIISILGFVLSTIILSAITLSCKRSIYASQKLKKEFKIINKYQQTKELEDEIF
ncbi:neuropilin and tolloid 1 [Brachionus plicatilis]|uniref:Neuropilin and tolloid 1 n=1 Tax=Brachionus plicatilis TaxID=10195 RepID=A0A3M7S9M9_BRAPC|nr:neuropilin and tolloid 1 [Brachionus plicatilis]